MTTTNMPPGTNTEAQHFRSIPWCIPILTDPDFAIQPTVTRHLQPHTTENHLLSLTLNTTSTISAWCSLYRKPSTSARNAKDEVRTLLALRAGLDGYGGICHGGVTATIFDEVMSLLVAVCRESTGLRPDNVTADLRVRYLRPVLTPSVVLCSAKVREVKGERKYFVDGEFVDENGVVLARGEGLFVHKPVENL
ncbi:hypothetical protein LTR84_003122 [Exophiala bonariae]|uniref:Thioesterase domain-containing protein n=1 Tax=Exophiala bonariae TaxID=1690606 RepID=A0AAV9NBJ8_9EURO|nr:hypothetical protein LTR84_003122 [Exophiala bonariae]